MAELSTIEEWLDQGEPAGSRTGETPLEERPLEEWELEELAVVTVRMVRRARELREAVTGEPGGAWVREPGCVAVGDEVVLLVTGEEVRFRVGSYLVPAERSAEGWVSYRSPLAALVLGARVGEALHGRVAGRDVDVVVVSVYPVG